MLTSGFLFKVSRDFDFLTTFSVLLLLPFEFILTLMLSSCPFFELSYFFIPFFVLLALVYALFVPPKLEVIIESLFGRIILALDFFVFAWCCYLSASLWAFSSIYFIQFSTEPSLRYIYSSLILFLTIKWLLQLRKSIYALSSA